jgi:hypothetical protein
MAQATVKRAQEEGSTGPIPKRLHLDPEDLKSHLENLTLFASVLINKPEKKAPVCKADFTNKTPRTDAVTRYEDDRTQTLSGYCLTDGANTYLIPVDAMLKWNSYDMGTRTIYSPIPLLKTALALAAAHDTELSNGVEEQDTEYSPAEVDALRSAYMSLEGRTMCKDEKDFFE